jgi:hypothetical protein
VRAIAKLTVKAEPISAESIVDPQDDIRASTRGMTLAEGRRKTVGSIKFE